MNPLTDLFTLAEAAEFLKVPAHRIGHAVIAGALPCGVIARNWTGLAIPNRNDIPAGEDGHRWAREVCEVLDDHHCTLVYRYGLPDTDISYRIRETVLTHFWYLSPFDAYRLFAVERDGIEVGFLVPRDGAEHHRSNPDCYLEADCTVVVDSRYTDARVTLGEVLFLRADLEKLRKAQEAPPLGTRERNTLLTLIAALCQKHETIDLSERGVAQRIAHLTECIGAGVGEQTIRKVLADVRDALETVITDPKR